MKLEQRATELMAQVRKQVEGYKGAAAKLKKEAQALDISLVIGALVFCQWWVAHPSLPHLAIRDTHTVWLLERSSISIDSGSASAASPARHMTAIFSIRT